jgi:hypothetical protein
MKLNRSLILATALMGGLALQSVAMAQAIEDKEFKTLARVEFVLDCAQQYANKMPRQEQIYKCSCAMDRIAEEVGYEEYVELSTYANSISIAGERGAVIRDSQAARPKANRFRELMAKARKGCFLPEL